MASIVKILLNLAMEEDNFCFAIAKDSRSYSADLYNHALEVLRYATFVRQMLDFPFAFSLLTPLIWRTFLSYV